jgi:hypothetical protein
VSRGAAPCCANLFGSKRLPRLLAGRVVLVGLLQTEEPLPARLDLAALALPADLESLPLRFRDGLGERRLYIERTTGAMVDLWCLRPELAVWHRELAQRAAHLASFEHPRVSPVLGVIAPSPGRVAVVAEHVPGLRLSVLEQLARERQELVDINAALYIARVFVHALAALEEATGTNHGAVGLERAVLTPRGRLVLVEPILGETFAALGLSPAAVWRSFGVARPRGDEPAGPATDGLQVAAALLSLLLGRPLGRDEYPDLVDRLLVDACERTPLGRMRPLSAELRQWLEVALGLDRRRRFATMAEARAAFDAVASLPIYGATRRAFLAWLERMGETPAAAGAYRARERVSTAPSAEGGASAVPGAPESLAAPEAVAVADAGARAAEPMLVDAAAPEPQAVGVRVAPASALGTPTAECAETLGGMPRASVVPSAVDSLSTPAAVGLAASVSAPESLIGVRAATAAPPSIRLADLDDRRRHRSPRRSELPPAPSVADLVDATSQVGRGASRRRWLRAAAVVVVLAAADGQALRLVPESPGDPRQVESSAAPAPGPRTNEAATAGPLIVTTDPAGAQVTVDGVLRGSSPVTVDHLSPGRHTVVVESERGTVRRTLRLRAGESADVHVSIYAGALVVSAPIELQILEGGQIVGTSDGGQILLPPGPHELELVNEALAVSLRRRVEIEPGALARLIIEPPPGIVTLESTPSAEVWIDGRRVGETPLAAVPVPLGTREIVFKHPALGERREVVTVTAAAPVRLSVSLPP